MKKFDNFLINDFLMEKKINEGLSDNTILCYTVVFNALLNNNPYIDIDNFSTFTEENFKRFLWNMLTYNKWTSWTYNRYKKNLKVFCDYLIREWFLIINPLKDIKIRKIEKCLPKFFNQRQIDLILYTMNNLYPWNDFISIRNRTIINTYLFSWLRLSELINLDISNVNFTDLYLKIKGKWNKERLVPIIKNLEIMLLEYLKIRQKTNTNNTLLFPTKYGWFLQHRDIYSFIDRIEKKLNFKITVHMFRHSFATELARKNINLYSISQILWHTNINTTKIYLNLNIDSVRNDMNNIHLFKT